MDTVLFKRRKALGIMCSVFCFILLIALLDGLFARFRQNPNEFHVLPGTQIPVIGPLPPEIQDLRKLQVTMIPEQGLRFTLLGTQTGYWLGGTLWRATVDVLPEAHKGKYIIKVTAPPYSKKPLREFTIFVYDDPKAIQRASLSIFRRYLDVNPWIVFCGALAIAVSLGGALFLLSSRIERLLREEGFGEIYRVIFDHEEGKTFAFFGLGARNGISEGDVLEVFNTTGEKVGQIEVKKVSENDGIGLWDGENTLPKQGFLVKKRA
jgi:hypothetical protein